MTERALSISTQIATPIQSSFNPPTSIPVNDASHASESVDDEPFTIKCICGYTDDDGNTIWCEACDTWQHIECYYPGRIEDAARDDFDHSCADCKPRPLESRHATEKQRNHQNKSTNDNGDKKNKRPASKSHKKKTKPSELQVNGFHDHDIHKHASPQDHHPPTKKAKSHRSHQSISSQVTKRSPPYTARGNINAHPPSPVHTPPDVPNNFEVHSFSDHFLSLYNESKQVYQNLETNSFNNLAIANKLALWVKDPVKLEEDAGKEKPYLLKRNVVLDGTKLAKLHVEQKFGWLNDRKLEWRCLTILEDKEIISPIGELFGQVGLQMDYSSDMDNLWNESVHPRPFVFFHPRLPIFIDTRKEGNMCRYVRRSCQPNAHLDAFISNQSEWHFWFVNDKPLSANEQITIPWHFKFPSHLQARLDQFLNTDDDMVPEFSDAEYELLINTIHLVLSDHGGCACDQGNDCAFVKFHRNYYGRVHAHAQSNGTNGVKSKKGRKPKQHVSPTSTGHATNSRAASEGHPEIYDEDDGRSVSGSVRSKPHSRDLTPLHSVGETNGILTEPTDREKRKLAMVEDSFRKMEQSQPPRKKKRASDGSNANSPVTNTATSQSNAKPRQKSVVSRTSVSQTSVSNGNGSRPRQYVDASTSRRQSGSPFSGASPKAILPSPKPFVSRDNSAPMRSRQNSIVSKTTYADSSTQTDRDEDAWYEPKQKPTPKKAILSLSKRLFKNRRKIHMQLEAHQRDQVAAEINNNNGQVLSSPTTAMDVDGPTHEDRSITESPTDAKLRAASISSSTPSIDASFIPGDLHLPDGPAMVLGHTMKPPPPWPGHANANMPHKSPELRVQMPPMLTFSAPNLSGTPGTTPSSAITSSAMSPFGTTHFTNGIAPSPAKKKMSLNDYKALKQKNADGSGGRKASVASVGSSPTMTPATLKPSLSTIEEAKACGALESGSAITDSPLMEKTVDAVSAVSIKDPSQKNPMPSEKTNGIL